MKLLSSTRDIDFLNGTEMVSELGGDMDTDMALSRLKNLPEDREPSHLPDIVPFIFS
ncbi:MAG: hypothetical protein HND49_13620 [Planctomycetes bacterium]|nr:hypothetical protein [Planctomycetota bacterium]